MRTIDPLTGKPCPRLKPMNWETARQIIRHRRAHDQIVAGGFREIREFARWPYDTQADRVIDTAIHPDGTRVYVKTEGTAK